MVIKLNRRFEFQSWNELMFVLYFWSFMLLRPILQVVGPFSKLVLVFTTLFIFITSIYEIFFLKKNTVFNLVTTFIVFVTIGIVSNIILKYNSESLNYLYKFVYAGLLPVLLLSKVVDYSAVIKYYIYFSALIIVIFGLEPIYGMPHFANYMDFGFNMAFPAFIGVFLGFHHYKIRWLVILEIIILVDIIVFSNRSTLASVLLFVSLYFFMQVSIKKIMKYIIPTILLIIIFIINIKTIVFGLYDYTLENDINSYSLHKFRNVLIDNDFKSFFSGRFQIWEKALQIINDNILFGGGMGNFESIVGGYSHNIVLDFMLFFGVVGLVVFFTLIVNSLRKLNSAKNEFKILGFIFFSLWFPKLFFSLVFIGDTGFWCFLAFGFIYVTKSEKSKLIVKI